MAEVISDGQTLKTLVLSKAARGKFISIHRTIRDLQKCDDYIDEAEGKGNDMELIKQYIMGQSNSKTVSKPSNDIGTLTNSINKLNDRLDKAGI